MAVMIVALKAVGTLGVNKEFASLTSVHPGIGLPTVATYPTPLEVVTRFEFQNMIGVQEGDLQARVVGTYRVNPLRASIIFTTVPDSRAGAS